MEIKGKVHCLFEQSGTFKREFIRLGYPAEDYDIQDNFGETDHVVEQQNNGTSPLQEKMILTMFVTKKV